MQGDQFANIEFEHHCGRQHHSEGYVVFYGLLFESILQASTFLRNTSPGRYKGVYLRGNKYLVDKPTNSFYNGSKWSDNWKRFKKSIDQC